MVFLTVFFERHTSGNDQVALTVFFEGQWARPDWAGAPAAMWQCLSAAYTGIEQLIIDDGDIR
jgi:hypothetical protein